MTLTPHEAAVAQLGAPHTLPEERLRILRFIKNNIIGNKTKKDLYMRLGVVPRLRDVVTARDEKDTQLKTQAIIVLGSFAFGSEANIQELINAGVVEPVLNCLSPNADPKLIEAATRTLNAIYASPMVSRQELFMGSYLTVLVQLLGTYSTNYHVGQDAVMLHTAELVASIFARCCETFEHQQKIASSDAIPLLMRLLASGVSKSQEAALGALAALVKDNAELARYIALTKMEKGERSAAYILRLVRDKSPTMRLAAVTCLAYMDRAGVIPDHHGDIQSIVLPKLVQMLQLTGVVQETAPKVLAYLIWESDSMQVEVCKLDAIPKLASIISQMDEEDNVYGIVGRKDKLKENSLLALAAISQMREECRRKVIDARVLPHIVRAMSHPSVGVRAAACQCTRSLSRSVKNLRTDLVDAGIELPLFELLSDSDPGVLSSATATLCNIVLDVCPMKKSFMERGIVAKFVKMIGSGDNIVRLNALWAVKNLVFEADSDIKETVMRQFGYDNLALLLQDDDLPIQEQALNLLRNLACKRKPDIELVFNGLGAGPLMSIIEDKLTWDDQRLLEHALYVLVNIATGSEHHKESIMKRPAILESVLALMSHDSAALRAATAWVIINLTWPDEISPHGVHERVTILRSMGIESKLLELATDHDLDVRDRVKTALQHFQVDQQQHGGNTTTATTTTSNNNNSSTNPTSTSSTGPMSVDATTTTTTTTTTSGTSRDFFYRPFDPATSAAAAAVAAAALEARGGASSPTMAGLLRARALQNQRDVQSGTTGSGGGSTSSSGGGSSSSSSSSGSSEGRSAMDVTMSTAGTSHE